MTVRGGHLYAIIADVCAFANTNGGTLYIGIGSESGKPAPGITRVNQSRSQLEKEISNRISPPIQCTVDVHDVGDKKILRVLVPNGDDPPYAVDDNKIYVRSESETGLAGRDEIVELVRRGPESESAGPPATPEKPADQKSPAASTDTTDRSPRTGVEVVTVDERDGTRYYTLRDLRNGNTVKNVTRSSARRLWHYAITQHDKLPGDLSKTDAQWHGDFGLLRHQKQGQLDRYDLIHRDNNRYRLYYGVTEDGIHGEWRQLVGGDED